MIFAVGTSLTKHNISTPIIPDGKRIIHATNDTRDLYKAQSHASCRSSATPSWCWRRLIEAVKDRLGRKTHSTGARHDDRNAEGGLARSAGTPSCGRRSGRSTRIS